MAINLGSMSAWMIHRNDRDSFDHQNDTPLFYIFVLMIDKTRLQSTGSEARSRPWCGVNEFIHGCFIIRSSAAAA